MTDSTVVIGLAAAAGVVCASGVVLTVRGRPYGAVLETIHKIVALAATVAVSVVAFRGQATVSPTAFGSVSAVATAVLLVVAFASGGFVSAREDVPAWLLWVHRALSWLSVLAAVSIVGIALGRF